MRRGRKKQELSPGMRALRTAAIAIGLILIFAYATQVTEINLEEPLEPQRQQTTVRVLRALARPDFFTYNEETRTMDISIRMPCPEQVSGSQVSKGERTAVITPNCATTTQDAVTVRGSGFRPRTSGLLRWYPPGSVATTRALTTFRTNADGDFEVTFTMPDIRQTDEPQRIEIEEKWSTGISGLSEASKITIAGIAETIFMALMATAVGILLAIPISFIAARNLMINVGSPLAAVMAGVIALPLGLWVGSQVMRLLLALGDSIISRPVLALIVALVLLAAAVVVIRLGPPVFNYEQPALGERLVSLGRIILALLLVLFSLGLLSDIGITAGHWLQARLGLFDFIGTFIAVISEFVNVISPAVVGLITGFMAMSYGSRYGQEAILQLNAATARLLTIGLSAIGSAVLVYGIGSGLNWLYRFDNPMLWTLYPALAAAVFGGIAAALIEPKRPMPIGSIIYTITRGILNIIRSIEPLVYVIIFAVWVGIGPFAGVLALTIHTVAALGKLFSEQVESIAEGPLEAITATGANRLQTIVFAVIPQIIPPYIAFTLYRWDINVRMSTIIGFGGGGGIGFVLAQAINLLQYRQASVMMIAIAVVVGTLDYVSSSVRSRII